MLHSQQLFWPACRPGYYGRLGQEQLTVVTLLVTAQGLKRAPQVVTFSNVLTLLEVLQRLPNESIKACQVRLCQG